MKTWRTGLTLAVCLGAGVAFGRAARAGDAPGLKSQLPSHATRGALERVSGRVLLKLESEECRRVFSDYADAQGRLLQENLDALGLTPAGYLRTILFKDGRQHVRCRNPRVMAFTSPGSRVVFLCPTQFENAARQNQVRTTAIVIHEAMHTLGLGENPPSTEEITHGVLARCY